MATGVPSTNSIFGPMSREALQLKSKLGVPMEIPGLFYNQTAPSPAVGLTSGTVTNSGSSMITYFQNGQLTTSTAPWGGDAVVTFSSSSGLLATMATSDPYPDTLNYNDYPIKLVGAANAVAPTGTVFGQVYYLQWVSATTFRLAATPGGSVIAYTDAGSGTMYVYAVGSYWGTPFVPAGFLQASDSLNQGPAGSYPQSGSTYRIEIIGSHTAATTSTATITTGLVTSAGATSFTSLIATAAVAQVVVGPFPFKITTDIMIQQYGVATTAVSPYVAASIRAMTEVQIYTAASGINTTAAAWSFAAPATTKVVSIDTTVPLGFDVRFLDGTPNIGNIWEPLWVRMWAHN